MKTFSVKIIDRFEVAEKTMAFRLEKPTDFSFTAGQYSVLSVPNLSIPDPKGQSRCMSIASAPSDDHLLFAMRESESGYKKTAKALSVGENMIVSAPVGQFVLVPEESRPVVFLAGGIGITPVRSILRQANFENDSREFFLFYSNYRPEDVPFFDEMLNGFSHLHYTSVLTMTDMTTSSRSWSGETGFVTETMLKKYISNVNTPMYYLVGTPGFTKAMEEILSGFGLAKESIKQDPFVGM